MSCAMENFIDVPDWLSSDPLKELYEKKRRKLLRGESLFDLSMINPDLDPPSLALDKLTEAILKPAQHRYAVSRGIRKLREAFAVKYQSAFGVRLDPEREICVCLGTKDAISLLLSFLCRTRPRVLVGTPCYPMYRSAAALMDLAVDYFPIVSNEGLMLEGIERKLKEFKPAVLLLNFPNNPTGVTVSAGFYRELGRLVKGKDCRVINDFVYGEMGFENSVQPSILNEPSLREVAFESYSLSKAYSIPGWRIGAVAGQASVIQWISKLKSHVDYGAFLPLQSAAASLLTHKGNIAGVATAIYQGRSRMLARGLSRLGWDPLVPGAGASVWAKLPLRAASQGSLHFAERLLAGANIVILPGVTFGPEYDRHVRFALVTSEERIREVLLRLESFSYDDND